VILPRGGCGRFVVRGGSYVLRKLLSVRTEGGACGCGSAVSPVRLRGGYVVVVLLLQ